MMRYSCIYTQSFRIKQQYHARIKLYLNNISDCVLPRSSGGVGREEARAHHGRPAQCQRKSSIISNLNFARAAGMC